jgi:hypothetical protein
MKISHIFRSSRSLTPEELERRENVLQAANAVMLGLAATAAAFAGYRSAILGGDALKDYTLAARTVNESSQAYLEGNQIYALDQSVFLEYARSSYEGNQELADYFNATLGSQELTDAIARWEALLNDAGSPFELDVYTLEQWSEGERLLEETNNLFASGQQNDDRGDKFDLAVAVFATALFLYGISAVSRRYGIQITALLGGTAMFAGGAIYMALI